ncbi:MAG: hypothetical protein ACR2PH_06800 [Desulfobulbia bacterium]
MITWTKRLLLTCTILGLLATNVLTLTSASFNAALSGFMTTAMGVATVTEALNNRIAEQDKAIKKHQTSAIKRKAATRKFGTRLATRTKRVAAASVAAIPGEAIPFLGFGILMAGTAYELYEACESMKDLDELYAGLGMEDDVPGDVVREVCEVISTCCR